MRIINNFHKNKKINLMLMYSFILFLNSCASNGPYRCNFFPVENTPTWLSGGYFKEGYVVAKGLYGLSSNATKQIELSKQAARLELSQKLGSVQVRANVRNTITQVQNDVIIDADVMVQSITDNIVRESEILDEYLDRDSCIFWTLVGVKESSLKESARSLSQAKVLFLEAKSNYTEWIGAGTKNIESESKSILRKLNFVDKYVLKRYGYLTEIDEINLIERHVKEVYAQAVARKLYLNDKFKLDRFNKSRNEIIRQVSSMGSLSAPRLFEEFDSTKRSIANLLELLKNINMDALVKTGYVKDENELLQNISELKFKLSDNFTNRLNNLIDSNKYLYKEKISWLNEALIRLSVSDVGYKKIKQLYSKYRTISPILSTVKPGMSVSEVEVELGREGFVLKDEQVEMPICRAVSRSTSWNGYSYYYCNNSIAKGESKYTLVYDKKASKYIALYGEFWLQFAFGIYQCSVKSANLNFREIQTKRAGLFSSSQHQFTWNFCKP
ncbi:MAG: hypothetical protein COA86_17895 [Kangiella sp.]|nr:MAG: hypothetical protein COA86_17895 [Kangiella sp.]